MSESPEEQLDRIWEALLAHNCPHANAADNGTTDGGRLDSSSRDRQWPTYDRVMDDVARADYNETLTCPHDLRLLSPVSPNNSATSGGKSLCPHGVVCRAKLELFPFPPHHPFHPYTGLLTPDTTVPHCLVRLSSAIKPPTLEIKSKWARALMYAAGDKIRNAKLFPTAAIKVFRGSNARSGNLLFGGCKVGQKEEDYFAHCQCTQMTERMPRTLKPFVRKFWKYSQTPFSLGVSDFCTTYSGNGTQVHDDVNFPFALVLHPRYVQPECGDNSDTVDARENDRSDRDSFDRFLDDVLAIPEGSILFDIYACPTPEAASDSSQLQRVGRIVSTSNMISSAPDDRLFFRHQRKEEDLELRPEWNNQLKTKVAVVGGRSTLTGTVASLAGWELFEGYIENGEYYDFET